MMCPKCDSVQSMISLVLPLVGRSKIQSDDKHCTHCGSKLIEKIIDECPSCKLQRRQMDQTIIDIARFTIPALCDCCAGCGYNFTKDQ